MKNRIFFYRQYDALDWSQQQFTKLNVHIYHYIINKLTVIYYKKHLAIFDIGSGIGYFLYMLMKKEKSFSTLSLYGCEPSKRNFNFFIHKMRPRFGVHTGISVGNTNFLSLYTQKKFHVITATYVFPHFIYEDLSAVVRKIRNMLVYDGLFFLVVADNEYMNKKLTIDRDSIIEENIIMLKNKQYREILSYADIPYIGTVFDYNRDEKFYLDLFEHYGFVLIEKHSIEDSGILGRIVCFQKKHIDKCAFLW